MTLQGQVYATSIDLKDAYWHVPVKPYFRRFLGFRLGRRKYRFRAMPFGLNIAPRLFTKICRPILAELRRKGINVLVYLDDWLVWADSPEACRDATDIVIQTLGRRGFLINREKSRLQPSQVFQWLGVHWDTRNQTLSLPPDKVLDLTSSLSRFVTKPLVSRRLIEQMLGRLQFAALVDPVGKALLKDLNRYLRPWARRGLRDRMFPMPVPLVRALKRWLRPGVLSAVVPFRPPPARLDIFTDASRQGWGVHTSDGQRLQGTWSGPLSRCHINLLELAVVFIALKRLHLPLNSHFRLHSDNATVVACLNRKGSARSRPLNSWTISILSLLQRHNWDLSVFHIAGVRNILADALSRRAPVSSEWSLDSSSFHQICARVGIPEVDLFATCENHKVPTYVSPVPDQRAIAVDAFTLDWGQWSLIYLFPPVRMLLRTLNILESYRGTAVLVTPLWPGQPWFPLAQARARDNFVLETPLLSQRVGGRTISSKSSVFRQLICWIL